MESTGPTGANENQKNDSVALSKRQAEIIVMIAKGKSNRLIAAELGLSVHTIDAYCKRIYMKFDTVNRVTAAVRAAQNQMLPRI